MAAEPLDDQTPTPIRPDVTPEPPTAEATLVVDAAGQKAIETCERCMTYLTRYGVEIDTDGLRRQTRANAAWALILEKQLLTVLINEGHVSEPEIASRVYQIEAAHLTALLQQVEEARLRQAQAQRAPVVPINQGGLVDASGRPLGPRPPLTPGA